MNPQHGTKRSAVTHPLKIIINSYFPGGMDPHRPADDPHHPPARDNTTSTLQRLARQRHDLAAARQPGAAGRQGVLHVPGQHQPDDQPSGVSSSCW